MATAEQNAALYDQLYGVGESSGKTIPMHVHYHRCKECRERMDQGCTDQSCAEGVQWVVLCIRCYERMADRIRRPS